MTPRRPADDAKAVPEPPPHALSVADIVAATGAALRDGLTPDEIAARRAVFGPNRLAARKPASALALVRHQFESAVVFLLAGAAVVAMIFGEWTEGAAIGVVLLINGAIGFVTELRAARSMEALRLLGSLTTRVRRGGRAALVPAEDLVPGESLAVDKRTDAVPADCPIGDRTGMVFKGTGITGRRSASWSPRAFGRN